MSKAPQITPGDVEAIKNGYDAVSPILLRDYFAAQAMALVFEASSFNETDFLKVARYTAEGSYLLADAMLAARQRKAVQG